MSWNTICLTYNALDLLQKNLNNLGGKRHLKTLQKKIKMLTKNSSSSNDVLYCFKDIFNHSANSVFHLLMFNTLTNYRMPCFIDNKPCTTSIMYHIPTVWFVDAHSKSNCCYDNLDLVIHKLFMSFLSSSWG